MMDRARLKSVSLFRGLSIWRRQESWSIRQYQTYQLLWRVLWVYPPNALPRGIRFDSCKSEVVSGGYFYQADWLYYWLGWLVYRIVIIESTWTVRRHVLKLVKQRKWWSAESNVCT